MNSDMKCSIVQDLLPNYIEKLTSEETNIALAAHLAVCEECKLVLDQMSTEVEDIHRAPKAELKFFKKIKKTRLLAAAISIILALILSYGLYAMEFMHSLDKGDLSSAITDYLAPFNKGIEAYVLETKEMQHGRLIVSFKNLQNESVNGIAGFIKGFNGKYRIVKITTDSSAYTSVVAPYGWEVISGERLIIVSGYNLSKEINEYGLVYSAYTEPGTMSDTRVNRTLKFQVPNLQFLEVLSEEELHERLLAEEEQELYNYLITDVSFYNEDGKDITKAYQLPENEIQSESSTTTSMELGLVYFLMFLVLGFGGILVRYFMTD